MHRATSPWHSGKRYIATSFHPKPLILGRLSGCSILTICYINVASSYIRASFPSFYQTVSRAHLLQVSRLDQHHIALLHPFRLKASRAQDVPNFLDRDVDAGPWMLLRHTAKVARGRVREAGYVLEQHDTVRSQPAADWI